MVQRGKNGAASRDVQTVPQREEFEAYMEHTTDVMTIDAA